MKKLLLFVLFTLVNSVPVAAEDKKVTIAFAFQAISETTLVGTYNLSGTLNESGPAEATIGTRTNDEGVVLLFADKVLHLAAGDIYLFVEGPLTFTGTTSVAILGKWRLTGGTGAYAEIKGHGKCAAVGDLATGTFTGAYEGKANVK